MAASAWSAMRAFLVVLMSAQGLQIRPGRSSDEFAIAATMARNLMNPLSIDHRNFLVAEEGGERVGFAQLRPLGGATSLVDPATYDAPPGSGSAGAEADDEAWDELPPIPTGLASLPWTREYREFAAEAEGRVAARAARRRALEAAAPKLFELASVYVDERRRGSGVGSELVRDLLERHAGLGRSASDIYLLTLDSTRPFYERLGFAAVDGRDVPTPLAFEVLVGSAVTSVLGETLVCMRGR